MSVRSALGYQLARAEILAVDSDGNVIPRRKRDAVCSSCRGARRNCGECYGVGRVDYVRVS